MVEIWSHVPKHDLSTISLRGVAQAGFVATDHHFVRYHGPEASDRQHHQSATCANFGCASTRIFRVVCRGGRHAVVTQLGLGLVKRYCPRLLVLYSGSERFPADTGLSTFRGRSSMLYSVYTPTISLHFSLVRTVKAISSQLLFTFFKHSHGLSRHEFPKRFSLLHVLPTTH